MICKHIVSIIWQYVSPNHMGIKTKPTHRVLEDTSRCKAWGCLRVARSTSLGAPLLSFSSANPRENSHRIHDLNTLGAFQDETKKATGSLFLGGQGGGDPMALCGLREIRSWGHFSLLKHLFLCAERKFVATDLTQTSPLGYNLTWTSRYGRQR